MKDFATPEILRVSLTNVILTLKSMKINDVINFEYMENPDKQTIFKALGELFLLNALNDNGEITELGIEMCKFPLEPPYSKALITSLLYGIEERMITLVSLLSTESIWKKVLRINEEEYNMYSFNNSALWKR
jgi:HrpA-like RNA helicase